MYKLLLFAGTTEGRELAEYFSTCNVQVTVCVATEYGQTLILQRENLSVCAGRLTQQEMEEKQYEATAGGGVITAVVSGKRELVRVTIDPEAVDPDDVEMLQDMVVAAVNEAMRKAEADSAQNMSKLTGGLNLGGLFG